MRPSSRQRVAAWLLALPLGRGGEECARRGRLEMISFWLLCWKLLRATAGLRRTTAELTDSNSSHSDNNPADISSTPTQPMDSDTMEISSSPQVTDLESDNLLNPHSQEVEELQYPEFHGLEEAEGGGNGKTDDCDYLVFEIGEKRGSERKREEEGEHGGGETEEENEARGEIEGESGSGDTEEESEVREREERDIGNVWGICGTKTEAEDKNWVKREIERQEEGMEKIEGEDGEREDAEKEVIFISDSLECPLPSDSLIVASDSSEHPEAAAMLQNAWVCNLGTRDELSEGHHSDCLQAELAVVYSDSEAGEEQWAASVNDEVTNQEQTGSMGNEGGEEGDRGEDNVEGEAEAKKGREDEIEDDRRESRDDNDGDGDVDVDGDGDDEQMRRRDRFLQSPTGSTTSSVNSDRRVPADFSVHQEMCSDNVSTEHVDFLLACQQWKKMEEKVKGQPIPKPGLRAQGSFQGTHISLYPPARSPRLKHREIHPPMRREPPLSCTLSPSSEDSGMDESSYHSPLEEPESAVEREIRLTLQREERHRRERGMIAQGRSVPRPSTLQTGRSPPRPPACRTPTLSISPSPAYSSSPSQSVYHEMIANNVIILEPDSTSSASPNRLLSSASGGLSDAPKSLDAVPSTSVIVVETCNLIIRSASEFCLSSATPLTMETQQSTFSSNPFFKLRSLSSHSLVEQEIKMVRQREEEWRRQREDMWRKRREEEWKRGRETYNTVLVSPGLSDNISFNVPEVPDRCVSSPSSPSRIRKMERSSLSCDHKFPPSQFFVSQRQNAMAQRWEDSLLANQKK